MDDPRISRMYLAIMKQWFASLYHGLWRRNLMRSGMVTGLLLALAVVGLGIAYREHIQGNFHKLKAKIGDERQDVQAPRPGGQEAIVLTRTRLTGDSMPEFLSATLLPGRGMNVLQITAYLPGKGEVNLLASPSIEGAESAMTGKGGDADGQASLSIGGAFEAPWAGRMGGVATQGGRVSAVWRGHAMSLPAAGAGGASARGGLMLAQAAETAGNSALPDGGQAQAVYRAGDFGAHWPSKTEVTVTVLLSSRSIELTVVASNAGDTAEPIGLGWYPRFAILNGGREQLQLHIPGELREVRDPVNGMPTGALLPVAGTPYDFTVTGGLALRTTSLDDGFVSLHQELLDNGPVAEFNDPADNYGLRLTALSPTIKAMRVVAPPDGNFVSIDPQFNYDDPFGREWGDTPTGMVVLQPGQSTEWKVRLELYSLAGSPSPM